LAEAQAALSGGQTAAALRAVRAAVVGLVADMRNIVAEGLTASEVDAVLAETNVAAADRADLLRLLEAIESAEYGSGAAAELATMIETAEALIPRVSRQLST